MITKKSHFTTAVILTGAMALAAIFSGCSSMTGKAPASFSQDFMSRLGNQASVAFYNGENGSLGFVADAAKNTITAYDLKKETPVKTVSTKGVEKDQVDCPVDMVQFDGLLFVLEKGNKRVQVFDLPDMVSLGFIGETFLNEPTNLALYRIENSAFYLYVADSEKHNGEVTNFVRKFSVSRAVNTMHSMYQKTFGYTQGKGYLGTTADLSVDQTSKQVIIADSRGASTAFTLEGDSPR